MHVGKILANAMPMNPSPVIREAVRHMDYHSISLWLNKYGFREVYRKKEPYPVGFNGGARHSPIDSQNDPFQPIRRQRSVRNYEPVLLKLVYKGSDEFDRIIRTSTVSPVSGPRV
jgi:hypothetical protein